VDDISELEKLAGKWTGKIRVPIEYTNQGISLKNSYLDYTISAEFLKNAKTEKDRIVNLEMIVKYDGLINSMAKTLSAEFNRTKKQIESDKNDFWIAIIDANNMSNPENFQNEYGSVQFKIKNHSFIASFSMSIYMFAKYFCIETIDNGFIINSRNNKIRMNFVGLGDLTPNGPLEVELVKK
jgi:hypothetical protein